jgi:hypothetical protein
LATLYTYALTTVADVKESLGIASSDTSKDNLITRKINQATDMIENYTGRRFKLTTYTDEEYDATNASQLILRQRPVVELTSFGIRDTDLNDAQWEGIDTELFFTDNSAGVIDLDFQARGRWNRYRITYSAGYSTIPSDVAEACASLAAFLTTNAAAASNVLEKEEGQRRVRYHQPAQGASSLFQQLGIDGILDSYSNYPILADK